MTFLYEVWRLVIPENIKTKSLLKTNYNKMRVSLGSCVHRRRVLNIWEHCNQIQWLFLQLYFVNAETFVQNPCLSYLIQYYSNQCVVVLRSYKSNLIDSVWGCFSADFLIYRHRPDQFCWKIYLQFQFNLPTTLVLYRINSVLWTILSMKLSHPLVDSRLLFEGSYMPVFFERYSTKALYHYGNTTTVYSWFS